MQSQNRLSTAFMLYFLAASLLAAYFAYAAVRGELGVIERLVITSELRTLNAEREVVEAELAALINKTRRMSDTYLDLDLLDEQARAVLGMMRADELIISEGTISR